MEAFLKGLYSALPSWARVLSDPIVSRLMGLYNWIFGLMRATIPNWTVIANGAKALRAGAGLLGFETFATLRWMLTIRIPQLIKSARDFAILTAITLINQAVTPVAKALLDFRLWTLARIAEAVNGLRDLRILLQNITLGLVARLVRLESRVFGVLGVPARLAEWIVGAMWSALWRYAWDNLDRLAESLWRRRQNILLRTVAEAERILGRLL